MAVSSTTGKTVVDDYVADALAEYMRVNVVAQTVGAVEAAPVAAEPILRKEKVSKKDDTDTLMFSAVFGEAPKDGDFPVKMCAGVHTDMVGHIRPVDPEYKVQVEHAARLVRALMAGDKTLITGPTGSGKSSLVKFVCSKMGYPYIRVNMSGDIESGALFGQLVVRGGATVWEDGPLTEAVRKGGVVLIDEWELMPPEISMGLQNLLEDDGFLFLKEMPGSSADKTIMPHPNFRIVCAGNTVGQGDDNGAFSGTSVQNSATIDRFTTTIVLDYLTREHEIGVITERTAVNKKVAGKMLSLASFIRTAYNEGKINLTMSPRTLINWGRKIEMYDSNIRVAFDVAFFDKLRASDKPAVNALYEKVFK